MTNIRFIKRIVVGSDSPKSIKTEAEVEQAMALVNTCLCATPRGYLVGVERSFGLFNVGEHQVVLAYSVYNIGFDRKPAFLDQHGEG